METYIMAITTAFALRSAASKSKPRKDGTRNKRVTTQHGVVACLVYPSGAFQYSLTDAGGSVRTLVRSNVDVLLVPHPTKD
jgi:hypothetical protein